MTMLGFLCVLFTGAFIWGAVRGELDQRTVAKRKEEEIKSIIQRERDKRQRERGFK